MVNIWLIVVTTHVMMHISNAQATIVFIGDMFVMVDGSVLGVSRKLKIIVVNLVLGYLSAQIQAFAYIQVLFAMIQ